MNDNCDSCRNVISRFMSNPPIDRNDCHLRGGCDCNKGCGTDKVNCCGCPQPVTSQEALDEDRPWIIRTNYGGRSIWYDYKPAIEAAQTDTTLQTSSMPRGLQYNAERHTDFIPAKDLGSVMHVADLGDVNISGVQDNSIFVFQKNANCAEGMDCSDNSWGAWNANDNDNRRISTTTIMGFDDEGSPKSLQPPANTNQYYNFGWNAQGKAGYAQGVQFTSFPLDSNNYAYLSCYDPRTMQQGYVKVLKGSTVIIS